jgi:uncharacterized membrane protein YidH (DUF202 family)
MSGDAGGRQRVIGLVADPGTPAEAADKLCEQLPELLRRHVSDRIEWQVEQHHSEIRLDEQGFIPLVTLAQERPGHGDWDYVIYLTDLPRRSGDRSVLVDISIKHGAGLVSLPALGLTRTRRRLVESATYIVRRLFHSQAAEVAPEKPRQWLNRFAPIRLVGSAADDIDEHLVLTGLRGNIRLLGGMLRQNRPWRLVTGLSSATAAAAGTSAFGIFYASIWQMADALPPWRLALITVLAIAVMLIWLVASNGLWDRASSHTDRRETALYNASTLLSVGVGVVCMYVVLFALVLIAAITAIDAGYLGFMLRHDADVSDYLTLAWLSTSLGTVAGALGSSFDNEQAVRQATYGRRQRERQARSKAERERREQQDRPTAAGD